MNRTQFLKTLGFSGPAIMAVHFMACETRKDDPKPAATTTPNNPSSNKVDFTLDLSESANSALNTEGGYVIANNIVIANTGSGFAAVTRVCSHEGNAAITYNASSKAFVCSVHGARFDTQGRGLNSLGSGGLKTYSTSIDGTKLRVFEP